MNASHLRPVDVGTLEDYPVDPSERLDSHGFLMWEFRRWLSSDMRWHGSHEAKSIFFELVNVAHGETPVSTLPDDLARLARMVQPCVDPGHFERLCSMPFGDACRCLYGFRFLEVFSATTSVKSTTPDLEVVVPEARAFGAVRHGGVSEVTFAAMYAARLSSR
ncbi:hypothetical protein [Sagittula sp. MA-2]|jgi:hypothetical protein|uniref:hypothetical protein n=1 Tax=Sagittula sp. MA-2 TaxID=3048007 RepID=UPI0024C30E72|nr:hypothetical protein [Sagittula sp. MA-2]WHZ37737.1 hypothetical protein QNI11_22720 [Sagittula sp. MA-2]